MRYPPNPCARWQSAFSTSRATPGSTNLRDAPPVCFSYSPVVGPHRYAVWSPRSCRSLAAFATVCVAWIRQASIQIVYIGSGGFHHGGCSMGSS